MNYKKALKILQRAGLSKKDAEAVLGGAMRGSIMPVKGSVITYSEGRFTISS